MKKNKDEQLRDELVALGSDECRAELTRALDAVPRDADQMRAWATSQVDDGEWITRAVRALAALIELEGPHAMTREFAQILERGYPVDWLVVISKVIGPTAMGKIVLPCAVIDGHRDLALLAVAMGTDRSTCSGRLLAMVAQWLREADGKIVGFEFDTEKLSQQVYAEAKARRVEDFEREIDQLDSEQAEYVKQAALALKDDEIENFEAAVRSFAPENLTTVFALSYYEILKVHSRGQLGERAWDYMGRLGRVYPDEMQRYLTGIVQALKAPGTPHHEALCLMKWYVEGGVIDEACSADPEKGREMVRIFNDAYDRFAELHGDPELLLEKG